jgi:hypothetical protein
LQASAVDPEPDVGSTTRSPGTQQYLSNSRIMAGSLRVPCLDLAPFVLRFNTVVGNGGSKFLPRRVNDPLLLPQRVFGLATEGVVPTLVW